MKNNLILTIRENYIEIEGYVNAVGRNSKLLRENNKEFIEQIKPSAFERSLIENNTVPLLVNHDYEKVIANSPNTMNLLEDNIGLKISARIYDPFVVSNKDKITGFSFGFIPLKTNDKEVDGIINREIESLELKEVSLLIDRIPAYDGTQANIREYNENICIREVINVERNNFSSDKKNVEEERGYMNKLKGLEEKLKELEVRVTSFVTGATEEKRALKEDEKNEIAKLEQEMKELKETISICERNLAIDNMRAIENKHNTDSAEDLEVRALANFVRGIDDENTRALTMADNKVIIPNTIANKIIEKVKELSPIMSLATVINAKGELTFPINNDNLGITAKFVNEYEEVTGTETKFGAITLGTHIVAAAAKISKQLINNASFNVVDYVVNCVAKAISELIEKTAISGTAGKFEGVFNKIDDVYTVASKVATSINADDLMDLQSKLITPYQKNAVWLMHPQVFAEIRKLKTKNDEYLLQQDYTGKFNYTILGKGVVLTESAPEAIKANTKAVVYGDITGLYIKLSKDMEIEVLREKYAEQYAIGVTAHAEIDMAIVEPQKLVALKGKGN